MERTTKAQLEKMVKGLNEHLNRPSFAWTVSPRGAAKHVNKANVGHLMLDHAACYGGYALVEIVNENGGEKAHFSGRRFSAQEMWWMLYAVRECVVHSQFETWPKAVAA